MEAGYQTNGCRTLVGMLISTFTKSNPPGSSTVYAYHYTKLNIFVHSNCLGKNFRTFYVIQILIFFNLLKLQITLWC